MTITEFAILPCKSPPDFSDPTLQSLFQKLSDWQSECSGFPLLFFTRPDKPVEVHLVTGWTSVGAHEAWIRGERNQELLRVFAPYVDIGMVRMVHLGVDFEAVQRDAGRCGVMTIERYDGASSSFGWEKWNACADALIGRDLARDEGDMYVFRFDGGEEAQVSGDGERWVLKKIETFSMQLFL